MKTKMMMWVFSVALIGGAGVAAATPARVGALQSCTESTIQAALNADGRARVDGACAIGASIVMVDRGVLEGRGTLTATGALVGPVIDASHTTGAQIRGLRVEANDRGIGVRAVGSERLAIVDVTVVGGRPNGIYLQDATRTTVRYTDALDSWNDGLAVRGRSLDTLVVGGRFADNGRDPAHNGNGIDLNVGGKRARLVAVSLEGNDGAGGVVEGGPAAEAAGWVPTDVQVIALDSRGNTGAGLELVRRGSTGPYPHRIVIAGAVLAGNGREGLYAGAGATVASGVVAIGNGRYGVLFPYQGWDFGLGSSWVAGNGAAFSANGAGAYLAGRGARVRARTRPGTGDLVSDPAQLDVGPQTYPLRRGATAAGLDAHATP